MRTNGALGLQDDDVSSTESARIAIFHPAFGGVGGAEILVASQAQYLARAGFDVGVVALSYDAARWRGWFEGVPVRVVESAPWIQRLGRKHRRLERVVPRAEKLLADRRAVMAENAPCNAILGATAIRARKIWCCTEPSRELHLVETNRTIHARVGSVSNGTTDVERDFRKRLRRYRVERMLLGRKLADFDIENTRKLDAIYAISEFSRESVRLVYGRNDTEVIYPIVRFPTSQGRARAGLDRTGLQVLTHSRLEIPKNVENVLRGFAQFSKHERAARLHVVGEGKERRRLEHLAAELDIAGATRFHGYLSDDALGKVYDACDVFALQPLDEPFGMVFPEAAARGLLLVGSDHGGPFEILDGGSFGWTCDPFSPIALADALACIWALSDGDVHARRVAADEACRSRYSEATIGPQLGRALTS